MAQFDPSLAGLDRGALGLAQLALACLASAESPDGHSEEAAATTQRVVSVCNGRHGRWSNCSVLLAPWSFVVMDRCLLVAVSRAVSPARWGWSQGEGARLRERILLTGGLSLLPNLATRLQAELALLASKSGGSGSAISVRAGAERAHGMATIASSASSAALPRAVYVARALRRRPVPHASAPRGSPPRCDGHTLCAAALPEPQLRVRCSVRMWTAWTGAWARPWGGSRVVGRRSAGRHARLPQPVREARGVRADAGGADGQHVDARAAAGRGSRARSGEGEARSPLCADAPRSCVHGVCLGPAGG